MTEKNYEQQMIYYCIGKIKIILEKNLRHKYNPSRITVSAVAAALVPAAARFQAAGG